MGDDDDTFTLEDAKKMVREREHYVIQEREPATGGWAKSGTEIFLGISAAKSALEKRKKADPGKHFRTLPKTVSDTYIAGRRDEALIRDSGSVWDDAEKRRGRHGAGDAREARRDGDD